MTVGSPEWAKATVEYAQPLWHSVENSEDWWRGAVEELQTGQAWRALGHSSLER